jgi:hypothetical protein
MVLTLAALAAGVFTNFEAGNLEKAEWLSEGHLRAAVHGEADQNGRNRQPSWFYFRIDGAAGRALTVDLSELWGEYNFRKHDGAGLRSMRPVFSYDNRNWTHFDNSEWIPGQSTLRVRFTPQANRVWIARQPPYTTAHLAALLADAGKHPHTRQRTVGKTVEGRPMVLLTITDPATPEADKNVVWLMARQHSWESGTSWVAEGVIRYLLSDDPGARRIRQACVFQIFPMADPDGVARGGVRFNKHGYDLNRNWDTVDPKRMPEIDAQRRTIFEWVDSGKRADLFLTLHNTETNEYIEGPLGAGAEMHDLGQRFWRLLSDTTAFHSPNGPRKAPQTTTPGMKGRMTVNQGLFHDRKLPAFLMELMVDSSPKLGRFPTVKDRLEFGAALARVMAEAAGPHRYTCRKAAAPILVDGRLAEPAWQQASWTAAFIDIEGLHKPIPRFLTRAKMLWDDEYFYIAAGMEEPHLWATLTQRDSVIFHDNDFEVFIDPNGDTLEYYEFEINALNTGWDLFLPKPYRHGGKARNEWDIVGTKTAVRLDGTLNDPRDVDRGWTVEIAFPWKSLAEYAHKPAPPRPGDEWRVNFSRVQWRTEAVDGKYRKPAGIKEDNWVWSPQGLINMHVPERWGIVRFVEQ